VVLGFSVASLLSAAFISVAVYLFVSRQLIAQPNAIHGSLEQQLLPQVSKLAELSRSQSHQAMLDINDKVNQLRTLHLSMVGEQTLSEPDLQHCANQISSTFKELLILLQFGDRLGQQQAGIIESIELIQSALRHMEQQGWDAEKLHQAIERIEQRTRPENDKSPAQEGSVTFF
jgi:hypothetical protein